MEESSRVRQRIKLLQTAAVAVLAASSLFLVWRVRAALNLPRLDAAGAVSRTLALYPALPAAQPWNASAFQKTIPAAPAFNGELAKRYRLAGTFFASGERQQSRKAILDDLQGQGPENQKLVGEGDALDGSGVIVAEIQTDYVILRAGARDEKIWLSFAGGPIQDAQKNERAGLDSGSGDAMLARFGSRVEDRRWLLKRAALLDYYQELMADTERLGRVFESLKPVYKQSRIAGYVLDVAGEKDMFHAFGLRQNDVIRKVNSMPMTSQRRAEYFISEFIKNRVNGFVLDIERDGKPQKFVYLIR